MQLFVVFIVFGALFGMITADIHRSKRYLIFPPTSPTRMQIIAGIGVPLQLEYESVTFGWTFKSEWFLADNTSVINAFNQDPLNPVSRPITNRRRRHAMLLANNELKQTHDPIEMEANGSENSSVSSNDRYEQYDVEAIEIDSGLRGVDNTDADGFYGPVTDDENYGEDEVEEDEEDDDDEEEEEETHHDDYHPETNRWNTYPKDLSTARWTLFKGIEILAQRKGLAGRACLLRSLCESARAPFSVKSGILGELMHIVMTPSLTKDTIVDHTQNEYLRAEELGRSGAPCDQVFKECTMSWLDKFTGIYNTVESLIKVFG